MTNFRSLHCHNAPQQPVAVLRVLLLVMLLLSGLHSHAQDQRTQPSITPKAIKLWVGGMSPALRDYEIDIFNAALTRSAAHFPPYRVEYIHRPMSSERSKIETERGTSIHAHYASEWLGQFVDSANVSLLNYPFLQEKLGLRKCLTMQQYLPRFREVQTTQDLQSIRIGQQRSWLDVEVYNHRGITVVESEDFDSLFAMLERDRYDCLPMSVLEIDRVLQDKQVEYPDLTIVPGLYVFYPIPVYLGVSKLQAGLAERLGMGLDSIFSDGTAQSLFLHHFKTADTHLRDPNPRLIVLTNPVINDQRNNDIIKHFTDNVSVIPLP